MKQHEIKTVLDACERRRNERRSFLRMAGGAGVAVAGASVLAACDGDSDFTQTPPTPTPSPSPTPAPSPTPTPMATDVDYLNFALNLEYLEAQFYSYAVTGQGLSDDMLDGSGTPGEVMGGAQVNFTDPGVAAYAREIAQDERAHVAFLREALGDSRVAQPAIDISAGGAFTAAARAAGLVGDDETFEVYGSDENFLLGAFIFEDVGVTAYKGAAPLISDPDILESAAGILSAEAYHAGLVRTILYRKGVAMPGSGLIGATESISDARDSLDGSTDLDQGIDEMGNTGNISANLVPTNENSIAFSRTPLQVHNIVYLTPEAAMMGGFFPDGTNGFFTESGANA